MIMSASTVQWPNLIWVRFSLIFVRRKQKKTWDCTGIHLQAFFSSPGITFRPSSVGRRPSVNISHFNLLLRNHWANCNQTLVEWSLDGPLPKLCPVIPTSNQDGHQAKNRKKGGDEILIVYCCFSISQNELKF